MSKFRSKIDIFFLSYRHYSVNVEDRKTLNMVNGWKTYKVNEFANVIGGGTPSTKNNDFWEGDIPWITPKDLSNHASRYISYGERNITEEGLANSSAKMLPVNTILLSSRAPVGYLAIAKNPLCTNQGIRNLVIKEGFSPEFIYYLLKNNVEYLKSNASGTTFQELSGGTLKTLEFNIPDYTTQCEIAHTLGTLDDKIEINQRMNATLEEIARAVFQSWFVDFDPVRAKLAGEPYPLPDEVMALFPDELVESELGMIPKGWHVGKVGDVYEFAYGKRLTQKIRIPGKYFVYGSNGIVGTHNEALVRGPGIIVGRKGNPGIITWAANDFFPIDTTFYILTNMPMLFAFYQLDYLDFPRLSADSAVPGLNRNIAYLEEIILPNDEILKTFGKITTPFYDKINLNNIENRTLIAIRDTLLPKLMGGEFII